MERRAYKSYLLAVLMAVVVFNYVDRVALGILLQDIKIDLKLTDTQLGFLTGLAFAAFYALMGIPIARWADRGNRVTIISVTTGVWSVAVALCGAAETFTQLLLTRVAVAIGEAGCHPPALSLIADYFERAERPRAVARYMLGFPLALLIGFFAGGWLDQLYGWRATFVMLGLPGLILAVLARITLTEPRRATAVPGRFASIPYASEDSVVPQLPFRAVLKTLWSNRAFRHLLICCSLSYFFANGILQWQPAFFARSYGIASGQLGTWFAGIYGLGGLLGTWLGGELAHRYAADNERRQLRGMTLLFLMLSVIAAGVYLVPDQALALGILSLSAIGGAAFSGPLFAATQTLVPLRMRAVSVAIVLFFCNLVGLGLGPLTAGILSDALRPIFGQESLRYSLLALCPGYLWCAWHLWRASRTVESDVAVTLAFEQSTLSG